MSSSIQTISLVQLALAFIPVIAALVIFYRWSLNYGNAIYAVIRMLVQLLLIGYLLTYIFAAKNAWLVLTVLLVMVTISSWIALQPISRQRRRLLYRYALISISLGGGSVLILITAVVLEVTPWYQPSQMIPLAGMIFANAMNTIALAAERLESETERGLDYDEARGHALRAATIPVINSLFAVGLVSLPGMMTGQILSGVSPLIAARYQIVVMCMIFGSAAVSSTLFLSLARPCYPERQKVG